MISAKLSIAHVCILFSSVLLLSACSSAPKDPTAHMTPNQIYAEAKEELNAGAYDKAIPLLEKLDGRAAGTPLAQQAQLDKAYAHYKASEPILAVATLDRFMKLHPASPVLDYALYLKGIVNFNDDLGLFSGITRQDLSERDQKSAKDSYEALKELVSRFPDSRYASDAAQRMHYIVNLLAQSEVHVARYYYQRGAYLAAVNRAQTVIVDYQGAPALAEALKIMVSSYNALGMIQLRDDTQRVLEKNYSDKQGNDIRPSQNPWWKLW